MLTVKNIEHFACNNETDLRKFMVHKTGIRDQELIDEAVQEFYVRLIEARSLETYDPNKGRFDTYILNLFCWTLPVLKKKGYIRDGNHISVSRKFEDSAGVKEDVDIWDCLHMDDRYKVDPSYSESLLEMREEEEAERLIDEFVEYIRETEKEKKAERMITFITRRREGCLSADVAVILDIEDNHVKCIKQELYDKYKKWQKRNMWS